ncbi:MAG: hypothetical protein V3U45_07330 [bacterium]
MAGLDLEDLRTGLRQVLETGGLPPSAEDTVLQLLQRLEELRTGASPEKVRKTIDVFWIDKGLSLEPRAKSSPKSPEEVVARLMEEARKAAQRRIPGGPGLGGVSLPEEEDPPVRRASDELRRRVDEALEKRRENARGGGL